VQRLPTRNDAQLTPVLGVWPRSAGESTFDRRRLEPAAKLSELLPTTIEMTGTQGSLFLNDTQRSNWLNTIKDGTQFTMSTMPGEWVDHV
jgi:hypothetical protein